MDQNTQRAKEIFLALAGNIPAAEWESRLDEMCAGNAALRQRVLALLRAHADPRSYLNEPAVGVTLEVEPSADVSEPPGTQIGPYKLLQQIGEGGFGVVYMAEQTEPVERRVALKIIKPGMDTHQVIARFEAEEQALAVMDHPNIAKVFDAGATDSGRPYFVMELVHGVPITQYCDQQHLSPQERLDLFIPVCHAVQHAHQKGIIHRDLKPSNVLVALYDDKPVPKVIDFGVAKATSQRLTERTMFTQFGQIVGTLEYMSPEQANLNQLDVDTRSDIYSLGVLLYELLTGTTPFDRQRLRSVAFDEMLRIIREEGPPKPSTRLSTSDTLPAVAANRRIEPRRLATLVHGELDWIVMKALEKDRARRYETANEFANDIQRYLNDEQVVACPPSAMYRLRKFTRRNKVALTTVAIVAVAVLLGIAGTTWQAIRATDQRDRALSAETLASERYQGELEARRQVEQQRDRAVAAEEQAKTEAAIVRAVNGFLNEDLLAQANPESEPDRDIKLRTVLDRAADRIEGRFADQPLVEAAIRHTIGVTYQSLGEYSKAQQNHERARELRERHLGARHLGTFESMNNLARAVAAQGHYAEAEKLWREVLEIQRDVLGPEHPHTLGSMHNLASTIADQGRYAEAEKLQREVLEIQRRMLGPEHPDTLTSMHNLAITLSQLCRYEEGEKLFREVLEICQRVLRPEHPVTLMSMMNLANTISSLGRSAEAETLYRKVLEIRRRVLGPEHPHTLGSMNNLATEIHIQHRWEEAERLYCKVLEIQRRMLGPEHPDTLASMNNLASVIGDQGRSAEAESRYCEVLETQRRVLGPEHPTTLTSIALLAGVLDDQHRHTEAEKRYREVLEIQQRVLGTQHPDTLGSLNGLANAIRGQGRYAEAETLYREVLTIVQQVLSPNRADAPAIMHNLARTVSDQGRHAEAVKLYGEVVEISRRVWGPEHRHTRDVIHELACVYAKQGQIDDALELFTQLLEYWDRQVRESPQKAVELMNETIELHPDFGDAWNNLGVAQYRAGNWQAAVEALEKADAMLEGGDRLHRVFLAMACWQLGEKEKARELYTQGAAWIAVQRQHNETRSRFRAEAEQLMGITEEDRCRLVDAYVDRQIENQPDVAQAWLDRARWHEQQGNCDEALADCNKCVELKPDDAAAAQTRTRMLLMAGRTEDYRQACADMLDRFSHSEDPRALYHAARACVLAPQAVPDPIVPVQLAEQTVSSDARERTFYTLAMAQLRAGQLDQAAQRFQQSLDAAPNWEARFLNWLGLALLHQERGEMEASRQWLDQAVVLIEQRADVATEDRLDGQLLRRELEQLLETSEQAKLAAESGKEE